MWINVSIFYGAEDLYFHLMMQNIIPLFDLIQVTTKDIQTVLGCMAF